MQTNWKIIDDVVIIDLKGQLSYESVSVLRTNCLSQLKCEKIIFNLKSLSFVGSCGIKSLIEAISELSESESSYIKLCGVGTEFTKIFQTSPLQDLEIYEDDRRAWQSFQDPWEKPLHSSMTPLAAPLSKQSEQSGQLKSSEQPQGAVAHKDPCSPEPSSPPPSHLSHTNQNQPMPRSIQNCQNAKVFSLDILEQEGVAELEQEEVRQVDLNEATSVKKVM